MYCRPVAKRASLIAASFASLDPAVSELRATALLSFDATKPIYVKAEKAGTAFARVMQDATGVRSGDMRTTIEERAKLVELAQLSYRLLPTLTLYTQLNNLTNRPDTALQSTARFLQEQEFYGSSVNLGLRYRPF